jgi:hypothetical protein
VGKPNIAKNAQSVEFDPHTHFDSVQSAGSGKRHLELRRQRDQLALLMRASFGKYRLQFIPDGLAPKAKLTSRFLW